MRKLNSVLLITSFAAIIGCLPTDGALTKIESFGFEFNFLPDSGEGNLDSSGFIGKDNLMYIMNETSRQECSDIFKKLVELKAERNMI